MKALIAKKIGMTSTIAADGTVTAITLLSATSCVVTQVKSAETDGYHAVQMGAQDSKHLGKSLAGHVKKSGAQPKIIREFRIPEQSDESPFKVGDKISADVFNIGDHVDVVGTSKGKGFAGTIKRHNFHRGRKTHGGHSYRRPGSIGSMYPQKIFKGKKMAGQLGVSRVTTQNLRVELIDVESNVIGVAGAVPGPNRGIVLIKESR